MFDRIRNFFNGDGGTQVVTPTTAVVENNGKFLLRQVSGNVVSTLGTYTRKRDAVRGATRRGLTVDAFILA